MTLRAHTRVQRCNFRFCIVIPRSRLLSPYLRFAPVERGQSRSRFRAERRGSLGRALD
jgi:hypothetical protein